MKPLIEVTELQEIADPNLIIIDASGSPAAKTSFEEEHIPGAIFMSLNEDLSEIDDPSKGGRHPLPHPDTFGNTLSKFGISIHSHVVVYDHMGGGNAAARLWWMLKAQGHKQVQVLNGGFQAWKSSSNTILSGQSKPRSIDTPYPTNQWQLGVIDLKDVIQASTDASKMIIDVREGFRYDGESEPIDLIAGHIPNAINMFFKDNLTENGNFKSAEELKKLYNPVIERLEKNEVIIHCGSGVTACHTILALAHAELPVPLLYVGSWSEWSRNNLPIASIHP